MKHLKLLILFITLAALFILLGLFLNNIHQINFGFIWLGVALVYVLIKKFKHRKT